MLIMMYWGEAFRCNRNTNRGGAWTFLANDTSSPYVDTEPQVDGTEYRAVYKIGDDKMDNWGSVASVKI